MPHLNERVRASAWWMAEYVVICEDPNAGLRGELERRYRAQVKHQGPDDPVFGRIESPRNVDVEHAYLVSEQDWETGTGWEVGRVGFG
jgi:hypothetical protein